MDPVTMRTVARLVRDVLTSPNVHDSNGESANLVDTTHEMAQAINRVADAIFALVNVVDVTASASAIRDAGREIAVSIDMLAESQKR